jgi:CMP-N-acetylneuraminic acid synthetase
MRITALLTGRGNNTLKDKNILPVFGKPLLYYPALEAKKVGIINDFFVSSDCEKILNAAHLLGYEKILRPSEYATPSALHSDVIKHSLEIMKSMARLPDILVVLLANTVMVKSEWIGNCINEILNDSSLTAAVPVYSDMDHHPYRAKLVNNEGNLEPFFEFSGKTISSNRQELPKSFFLCHNFWVLNLRSIKEGVGYQPWTFMGNRVRPIEVAKAFDVHTIEDIEICKQWLIENNLVPS